MDDIESVSIDNQTAPPEIIYQEDSFLVLYKPERYYVHPPENKYAKQKIGRNTCIHWIKDHLNIKADPIHRLDYATEGLVIFGIEKPVTQKLNKMMLEHRFKKSYDAIVRGWFKDDHGTINLPLELDSTGQLVPCVTNYSTKSKIELPFSVNSSFPTSRYSWIDIDLKTGRWHQIRRHMNRVAHPVLGDREHGDSHHNRFFRDELKINGLLLRARHLQFEHPVENKIISLTVPEKERWIKLKEIFKYKSQ